MRECLRRYSRCSGRARFFGDRDALTEARRLIDECGYGRRLPELEYLEANIDSIGAAAPV